MLPNSRSVCVDAADLHVDLLLSDVDVSLPKIQERLPPDFTSFTASVASRVQEPNLFAFGE